MQVDKGGKNRNITGCARNNLQLWSQTCFFSFGPRDLTWHGSVEKRWEHSIHLNCALPWCSNPWRLPTAEDWPEAGWTEEMAAARYNILGGAEEAAPEARTLCSRTPAQASCTEATLVWSGRRTGGWQGSEHEERSEWVQKQMKGNSQRVVLPFSWISFTEMYFRLSKKSNWKKTKHTDVLEWFSHTVWGTVTKQLTPTEQF